MKKLKKFIRNFNPIISAFIVLSLYLPSLWISGYLDSPKMVRTVAAYCVIGFAYGAIMFWAHEER